AVTWWPVWRVLRLVVTLVHELGHALVGVMAGRRLAGFVLRADMSGHAVTVGPAKGPGGGATTWAGYPAPAPPGARPLGLGSGRGAPGRPPRGRGVVATTWAGYPAPALLGALLVWLASAGWSAPLLTVLLLGLLVSLVFVRSALTLVVVTGTAGALGGLWWWG